MNQQKLRTPAAAFLLLLSLLLDASGVFSFLRQAISWPEGGMLLNALLNFAGFALNAVLCIMLFGKKSGNGLLVAIAGHVAVSLIYLIRYDSLNNFLVLASNIVLLAVVVMFSEQTMVKGDFEKLRGTVGGLVFLPALLQLIPFVIRLVHNTRIGVDFAANLISYIAQVLGIAAVYSLAAWLKNPRSNAPASGDAAAGGDIYTQANGECAEGYCGLGKFILLSLFTFGIWPLVWIFRTTKFLNSAPGVEPNSPGAQLLLCMFIPFYQIFWFYKQGQRIDTFSRAKKLNHSDAATLCLVLGIFLPIVACIIMQDRINGICTAPAAVSAPADPEALAMYKDLLDKGVITQEEFDAKKKQLLGL